MKNQENKNENQTPERRFRDKNPLGGKLDYDISQMGLKGVLARVTGMLEEGDFAGAETMMNGYGTLEIEKLERALQAGDPKAKLTACALREIGRYGKRREGAHIDSPINCEGCPLENEH